MNKTVLLLIILAATCFYCTGAAATPPTLHSRAAAHDSTQVSWKSPNSYAALIEPLKGLQISQTIGVIQTIRQQLRPIADEQNHEKKSRLNTIAGVIFATPQNLLSVIFPLFCITLMSWIITQFYKVYIRKLKL